MPDGAPVILCTVQIGCDSVLCEMCMFGPIFYARTHAARGGETHIGSNSVIMLISRVKSLWRVFTGERSSKTGVEA